MYFSSEGVDIPQEQVQFRHYDEEGNEYWEVDKILDRKIDYSDHKRVKYLVSWKGFGEESHTWEPIENLETVLDDVQEFERKLKEEKNAAKKTKALARSQPKASKKPSAKKIPETKIEESATNTEQEPSSPTKSLDESDEVLGVRIKKKTRNTEGKSSAQGKNKQNSHEDSTASSKSIVPEISQEAMKENTATPIRDKLSSGVLPQSNIDPTFQNLSKLMEVEEKPSPIILNEENNDEISPNFIEEFDNVPQENNSFPAPEVMKQELPAKITSDKTKKNLENMFDELDQPIEVEDCEENSEDGVIAGPSAFHAPSAQQNSKKINVAEVIKPKNIVIESDDEEEKISRKYSDNSKKDISPREPVRKDSRSRSPFDQKDHKDHKKNHNDKYKHDKYDDYKGKDRHYDNKKKRDRSRSHDRDKDKDKDYHRDYRDKERERERERDKDRYKSKDKPSHSYSNHHDTHKNSKPTPKDSYNDKREKSISPTYKDNKDGKKFPVEKEERGGKLTVKHPAPPQQERKSTGASMPRSVLASKAAFKRAPLFTRIHSSDEESEEDKVNDHRENHSIPTSKSPNNQENLKDKDKSPVNRGMEIKGVEQEIAQAPKKREVFKKILNAKNQLKQNMEEEMERYYKGLVGDYLSGKVNKDKFVEMLSVEGNFKEDQVQDILFMSWEGKATMNPQDYYFKVVWKTRENGVQMPSRFVSWDELMKESPENIAEFVMKKLLNIVTKYGTFGEC